MQAIDLKGNGKLKEGFSEIQVPYKNTTYILPILGPDYYSVLISNIDSQKMLRPTTAQVLALIDIVQKNLEMKICRDILRDFRDHNICTATESLSSKEGIFVYDNIDGKMPSDLTSIQTLFDLGDEKVRFIEHGYQDSKSLDSFLNHPYTLAQVGDMGLQLLENIAKRVNSSKEATVISPKSIACNKFYTTVGNLGELVIKGDNTNDNIKDTYVKYFSFKVK